MLLRAMHSARSVFLIFVLALGSCKRDETSSRPTNSVATNGPVLFEDATARSSLDFLHDSGATGTYFMPEHVGSGAALFDCDNDGRLDVLFVQCAGAGGRAKNRLFRQEQDGSFRDASDGSGLDVSGHGMGAACGDVNNDGLVDALLTEYGAARLFLNRGGGKFHEATSSAGLDNARWATAAAFFDYDRDGWLDLVVVNYLDYSPTHKCFDAAGVQEYCGPQNFQGTVTRLFRNLGGAEKVAFEDVTVRSGLARHTGPGLGVLCADFDGDRWPDILVADDGRPNRLFMNRRDGTFVEEAAQRGIAYNVMGGSAANMGIAHGDANGDGLFDVFVTHLTQEQHALWIQNPRGLFQDVTAMFGLVNPAWRGTGFGAVFIDFDHDGWEDLAFVNGLVKRGNDPAPRVEGLKPFWSPYAQRNQLFLNGGNGRFTDVSLANPDFCGRASVGRGLACGDLDNDGDIDLVATSTGGPAQFFRNSAAKRGHWLVIRAIDPKLGGRDAHGAEIIVEAGERKFWRLVQPSYSYLVSNDPRAHFGLGTVASINTIRVLWPDGSEEYFEGGKVDRHITLSRGAGRPR